MATVPLTTYRDAVRRIIDFMGASVTPESTRDAKRAVVNAYRELASAHRWSYAYQRGRLDTVASQTSSTIVYDHSGSAYEREVTIASGTWPSWAALGTIVISDVSYEVATKESSTVLTLSVNSNPGADVAAGTSYTLYRDTYPLPSDFGAMGKIGEASNATQLSFVHPNDWIELQRRGKSPGSPAYYCVTSDPNYTNAMGIRFQPPPDSIYHYDYIYQRRGRPLKYEEYSTGTVSVSASGVTVTGSGTVFDSKHVGAVIRLSANSTDTPEGVEWSTPYEVERVITAYTSTTNITVDTAFTGSLSGVKYIISDPVDIEDGAMMNAFWRCCEKQVATSKTMRTKAEAERAYMDALILAREADSRNFAPQFEGGAQMWPRRLADMPITF